jgi:hypothetical protein
LSKRATQIADEIRTLEKELRQEIQRIRINSFEIREQAIHFKDEVVTRHRTQALSLLTYLRRAKMKHIICLPIIWSCLLPAIVMDAVVSLYQMLCFSLFGIPKVKRSDHVVFDRRNSKVFIAVTILLLILATVTNIAQSYRIFARISVISKTNNLLTGVP